MIGNRETSGKRFRFVSCAALLALLAASSYMGAGRRKTQAVGVPVMIQWVSQEAFATASVEETSASLASEREKALSLLQSVLDDPRADEATAQKALEQKTCIARRMETEACVSALLEQMGFEGISVVMGEETISIVAPWQIAENEHNRVHMIDAAASQTGFSAERVKIILAKN